MELFVQETWEHEVLQLSKLINRWFCFGRRKKMEQLVALIRVGSAHYQHGVVKDRERLKSVLNEVEAVAQKYLRM